MGIYIPNGQTIPDVATKIGKSSQPIAAGDGRYCGRFLGKSTATASETVCSRMTPFSVGVFFDATEAFGAATPDKNEANLLRAGLGTKVDGTSGGAAGTYGF